MVHIAILGFGIVGSGTAEVLIKNKEIIKRRIGEEINIKYILDRNKFSDSPFADKVVDNFDIILNDPEVSIVAEMLGRSHPAFDFSLKALQAGKSVVTSNKEVVAKFGDILLAEANKNNVSYLFEASVGGGIPIIRPMTHDLAGNDISEINGILNGTTNYILTQMLEQGMSFDNALKGAMDKGYAEKDPTDDVEGTDASRKISILSAIAYGRIVDEVDIYTEGITKITKKDAEYAKKNGYSIKLIAHSSIDDDGKLFILTSPRLVPFSNPLANISDVFNGILVNGNAIGSALFYGRGAGKLPTASAVVADIVDIALRGGKAYRKLEWSKIDKADIAPIGEYKCKSYISLKTNESIGEISQVFGDISNIEYGKNDISFITPLLSEKEITSLIANFGAELLTRIRVL